jgi:hypothetical protein
MPAHKEGRGGYLPFGTQIQSLRMLGPHDGAADVLIAGHRWGHFFPRSGRSWVALTHLAGFTIEP